MMSSVHPPEAQQVIAELGRTLRRLRYARNLRLDEMKQRSGLHTTAIVRYESGGVAPTFPQLVRLATGLGMSASELVAAYEEDTGTIP
jgi:transcriptional regulator with XRE-family HTH domain